MRRLPKLKVIRDAKSEVLGEIGTGNVFADLGSRNSDLDQAKAALVLQIEQIMDARGLTQAEAGRIIGLPQPKLSQLLHGHWKSYSLDRLTRYITALGANVRISVERKRNWRGGELRVSAL